MRWDHPTADQWCTPDGAIIIQAAPCSDGYEIKRRATSRDYFWERDEQGEVRVFETLRKAKAFGRTLGCTEGGPGL